MDIVQFLLNTRQYVNPLQYSVELTAEEARSWLRSEKLRDFPRFDFLHRGSPACDLIELALVWNRGAASLFPASCRQRARELLLIPWQEKGMPISMVTEILIPYVIDRWEKSKAKSARESPREKRILSGRQ